MTFADHPSITLGACAADARTVWSITMLLALSLFGVAPILFYLSIVWFGPENPSAFGSGNGGARIFNGGNSIYGLTYLLLAIGSWAAAANLVYPLRALCVRGRVLSPSRLVLLQMWRCVRFVLVLVGVVNFLQDVRVAANNPRYFASSTFSAQMLLCASCLLFATAFRPNVRRTVRAVVGRCAARQEVRALAAVSTIIGSSQPKVAVEVAALAFRGLPFEQMSESDWLTNQDTGLNKHVVPLQPGECSAFITHSWADPGDVKWKKLLEWREGVVSGGGPANPIVWLDKACIDQVCQLASIHRPLGPRCSWLLVSPPRSSWALAACGCSWLLVPASAGLDPPTCGSSHPCCPPLAYRTHPEMPPIKPALHRPTSSSRSTACPCTSRGPTRSSSSPHQAMSRGCGASSNSSRGFRCILLPPTTHPPLRGLFASSVCARC